MAAMTPRQFFDDFLKPAVDEWTRDCLSRHKAIHALTQADVMAERMFLYLRQHVPTVLAGAANPADYRKHLRARCPALGLAWDAHDTHKHGPLRSHPSVRLITRGQGPEIMRTGGFGISPFGTAPFGGGKELVLVTDDGVSHELRSILGQVLEAWEGELRAVNL